MVGSQTDTNKDWKVVQYINEMTMEHIIETYAHSSPSVGSTWHGSTASVLKYQKFSSETPEILRP